MSLFWAELRKVWGNRLFPLLLAVLAAANLLLLWMGTRPTIRIPLTKQNTMTNLFHLYKKQGRCSVRFGH